MSQWRLRSRELIGQVGSICLDLFYPPHCDLCRTSVPAGRYLCEACMREAKRVGPSRCHHCSRPFDGMFDEPIICPVCRAAPPCYDEGVSVFRLDGPVRDVIHRFKYEYHYHLRHPLSEWLLEGLRDPSFIRQRPDCLVPVPLHPARRRERGFNQSDVLAALAGVALDLPVRPVLQRTLFTPSQTRLQRQERMENLRNAFQIRQSEEVRNLHPVLIDDVLTTGSTVNECARVLKAAGAASVRVVTLARG